MPSAWYSLQPVQRVGDEEVADLVAAVVEDQRAPVRVRAAARVRVLVERRAVEPREREVVAREVGGHPVEDHAEALAVQAVDERAEVVRRPEARRRREVAADLVAPRAGERVRHHRQQLDVREAHVERVRGQLVGQLEVGQRPVALHRVQPPRAEVDLVDRHRAVERLGRCGAPRATSRRPTRGWTRARPTRSWAAPRWRTRPGRPSGGSRRPARGSRTCSGRRTRRRAGTAPRRRTRPSRASGGCGRPRS